MNSEPPVPRTPTTVGLADEDAGQAHRHRHPVRPVGHGEKPVAPAPVEQEVNPFVEQAFEHQSFFTRLHQFVHMSDAYIVAPGGIGTVLESMMIWQLLQVRHLHDTPLIFAGQMWRGLVDWASTTMLRPGFELAGAEDMRIPHCVDDADQAVAIIREHLARWQAIQKEQR